MSKSRTMRKSRGMSMTKSRTVGRRRGMRRGMRGGKTTGTSDYATNIASSSDNYTPITSSSGPDQQDRNRNPMENLGGEGPAVNLAYNPPEMGPNQMGGRSMSRSMRRSMQRSMRRSKTQRGGEDFTSDVPASVGPSVPGPSVGGKRYNKGGSIVATAAVPFGLWGLQRYFQGRNSSKSERRGTFRRRRA
jgi:hypothetical protein